MASQERRHAPRDPEPGTLEASQAVGLLGKSLQRANQAELEPALEERRRAFTHQNRARWSSVRQGVQDCPCHALALEVDLDRAVHLPDEELTHVNPDPQRKRVAAATTSDLRKPQQRQCGMAGLRRSVLASLEPKRGDEACRAQLHNRPSKAAALLKDGLDRSAATRSIWFARGGRAEPHAHA